MALYAPEAVFVAKDGRTITDRTEIAAQFQRDMSLGLPLKANVRHVFVGGDTGPLHIAAAMGAPIVGLFGPTRPERNGPWDPDDEVISRAAQCRCHHKRQCLIGAPCIEDISLDEVIQAVDRRLTKVRRAS